MLRDSHNLNMKGAWSYPPRMVRELPPCKTGYYKKQPYETTAGEIAVDLQNRRYFDAFVNLYPKGVNLFSDYFTKPTLDRVVPVVQLEQDLLPPWRQPVRGVTVDGPMLKADTVLRMDQLDPSIFNCLRDEPVSLEIQTMSSPFSAPGDVTFETPLKENISIDVSTMSSPLIINGEVQPDASLKEVVNVDLSSMVSPIAVTGPIFATPKFKDMYMVNLDSKFAKKDETIQTVGIQELNKKLLVEGDTRLRSSMKINPDMSEVKLRPTLSMKGMSFIPTPNKKNTNNDYRAQKRCLKSHGKMMVLKKAD